MEIFWTENDTTILESKRFAANNEKLYISHILPEDDSKLYACYYIVTDTPEVIHTYEFSFHVQLEKKVLISKPVEKAIFGKPFELYCIFSGCPTPRVVWLKDDDQSIKFDERVHQNPAGNIINFKSVTFEDAGDYECIVNEKFHHTFHMDVLQEPAFTIELKSLNATVGQNIDVKCEAIGKPAPKIQWTRNGNPISVTDGLNLGRASLNDTGNYGCTAKNDAGQIYKDFYLNVVSEPRESIETQKSDIIVFPTNAPKAEELSPVVNKSGKRAIPLFICIILIAILLFTGGSLISKSHMTLYFVAICIGLLFIFN